MVLDQRLSAEMTPAVRGRPRSLQASSLRHRRSNRATAGGNRKGYSGYENDGVLAWSQVYHVRNRVYHAGLGQWTRRDSLEYDDGINLYAYVGSSPLIWSDPSGLKSVPCTATCDFFDGGKNIETSFPHFNVPDYCQYYILQFCCTAAAKTMCACYAKFRPWIRTRMSWLCESLGRLDYKTCIDINCPQKAQRGPKKPDPWGIDSPPGFPDRPRLASSQATESNGLDGSCRSRSQRLVLIWDH